MLSVIITVILLGALFVGVALGYRSYQKTRKVTLPAILTVAIAVVLLATVPASIHTVNPGEVAVVKVWGDAKYTRNPGTYFDFWISREYAMYDTTVQQENIQTVCYSSDAQTMDVALVVQYQIQSDKATDIANNYGGLERLNNRIEAVSIDKAKTVLSQKSAMNIIETRSTVSPAIYDLIVQSVTNDYYVDIVTVVITNIDFSDNFESTVEDKMIAEQQKLKAEYEKEKAIIEAEKELEVAKLEAQAAIAKAEGDAEATLRVAEAKAKAVKVQSIEVARMMGFTITETTVGEDKVYDIDFEGKSAEEIELISSYVKYISYLETWDGTLPTTLVTDGSAMVLIPAND